MCGMTTCANSAPLLRRDSGMVGRVTSKIEAPLGELVELYEHMGSKPAASGRQATEAGRLKQAADLASDPIAVAEMFCRDVERFKSYDLRTERFHSGAKDRDTKDFARSSKT